MHIVEHGKSVEEAIALIHAKYGHDVQITGHKSIPRKGLAGLLGKEIYEVSAAPLAQVQQKHVRAARFMEQGSAAMAAAPAQAAKPKRTQAQQHSTESLKPVMEQIQRLYKRIDAIPSSGDGAFANYPELLKLQEILIANEFSPQYIDTILQRAKSFFAIEQIQNEQYLHATVLSWIIEDVRVQRWDETYNKQITVFVGPTGVGKTTTLAKIAKIFGYDNNNKRIADVALLTIDNYRLAAKEQLEGYGRPMEYPVHMITTQDELGEQIEHYKSYKHILIDTIGRSPQEVVSLGEMYNLLEPFVDKMNVSLVLNATTKINDLKLVLRHYQPFNYDSIIVSKADETRVLGSIFSALQFIDKPITFITTGQRIPDIVPASAAQLLEKMSGFAVDSGSIEQIKTDRGQNNG